MWLHAKRLLTYIFGHPVLSTQFRFCDIRAIELNFHTLVDHVESESLQWKPSNPEDWTPQSSPPRRDYALLFAPPDWQDSESQMPLIWEAPPPGRFPPPKVAQETDSEEDDEEGSGQEAEGKAAPAQFCSWDSIPAENNTEAWLHFDEAEVIEIEPWTGEERAQSGDTDGDTYVDPENPRPKRTTRSKSRQFTAESEEPEDDMMPVDEDSGSEYDEDCSEYSNSRRSKKKGKGRGKGKGKA